MKRIAILASGSGTNAENIARYFQDSDLARVVLIASNNTDAGVIQRARKLHIPTLLFDRTCFYKSGQVLDVLQRMEADLIVLAGFMMLIPEDLVKAFEGRIVNIHPALLPAYGGKGMYGQFVHEAVVAAGEKQTGITIHFVNEHYDEGQIIFQAACDIAPGETPDQVAANVHQLEYKHYPAVIESVLRSF